MQSKGKLNFEILIDDSFVKLNSNDSLAPVDNKSVLSLINDFEDGKWRYKKFQNFIWDNIAETSLSYKERMSLVNQSHSLLTASAQNLRLTDKEDDISKGSELAEIFLYALMKHYYHALPVVPKIFYKQNAQDNAKGADSVHIVLEGNNDFSLWFGEAKFYTSIDDARLYSIIKSVGNSLQTEKLKKENGIITNVSDLDFLITDETLKNKIKDALAAKESIDNLKSKIHIPILLLHECPKTNAASCLTPDYIDEIIKYHTERAQSYFEKQVNILGSSIFKYSEINFHIILFPVPSKDEIVNKFVSNVNHYKNQ